MKVESFHRALRAFERRVPFKSFTIEFMSGDRLLVTHPEAISIRGDVILYQGKLWAKKEVEIPQEAFLAVLESNQ